MSVHLLTNTAGSVEHTLLDDLESFFHVLCYIVLVRCEHGLDQKAVKHHLRTVYDAWFSDDGDDSDETIVEQLATKYKINMAVRIRPPVTTVYHLK